MAPPKQLAQVWLKCANVLNFLNLKVGRWFHLNNWLKRGFLPAHVSDETVAKQKSKSLQEGINVWLLRSYNMV